MRLVLFGLSLVGTLLALDVYLQTAGIQTPMETRIDPQFGPTYIPGKKIVRYNEGFYIGAPNKYGYMGPSVAPRRTGSEVRILLLGDSYVLGHTVFPRHHFARVCEQRLTERRGVQVHVLNFGKADFNLSNMYQYDRDFAESFDHDLTLFCVDSNDLVPTSQIATSLYPQVTLAADSLVIDRSFNKSAEFRFYGRVEPVLTRSAVLRLAFNTFKMIKRGELRGVLFDKLARTPQRPVLAVNEPRPRLVLPALTRAILESLALNSDNILVINKALPPELYAEVESTGIPVIDLAACLDSLEATGTDPYYWPATGQRGHWNHATHVVVGRFLADELAARLRTKVVAN